MATRAAWMLVVTCACVPPQTPPPSLAGVRVLERNREVAPAVMLDRAAASALVCIGEQHDDAKHHRLQTDIATALADRRTDGLAIGMEMFGRQAQPLLDAYRAGKLGAEQLRVESDWDRRWGFEFAMYRPLLELGRQRKLPLIGLNAPREITRAVARHGLEGLPAPVRESLPELDLADAQHRKFFWEVMGFDGGGHGHGPSGHGASAERFYTAQVIWDETMAESAAAYLSEPSRQIVVIAGNGHCHEHAIPARVKRRTGARTLSLLLRTRGDELPSHVQSDYVLELAPPG